jgi:hypothetical protein
MEEMGQLWNRSLENISSFGWLTRGIPGIGIFLVLMGLP